MNKSIIEIVGKPHEKIENLISALRSIGAPIDGLIIDHIGLGAGQNPEDYVRICSLL